MGEPAALEPTREFLDGAAALGVEFEPGDVERLGRFLALLLDANATTNLTAITDPAEAWRKHLLDAVTLVPVVAAAGEGAGEPAVSAPPPEGTAPDSSTPTTGPESAPPPGPWSLRLVDIGSGGGVPAIPLAIVMPHVHVTLVEATGKKVEFLRRAAKALGLPNVEVIQGRAEGLGQDHKGHREGYDVATARALGHLAVVAELAGPLVRPRGYVVAVKGAKAEQELTEAGKALGLIGLRHAQTVETPTGRLVVLEKTIRTPRLYPRRDGEPARVPLGVARKSRAGEP